MYIHGRYRQRSIYILISFSRVHVFDETREGTSDVDTDYEALAINFLTQYEQKNSVDNIL
jgi:hypothetical protein